MGVIAVSEDLALMVVEPQQIKQVKAEAELIHKRQSEDEKQDENWARVDIVAPMDGTIVEKNATVGDIDTSSLFMIADLSVLSVILHAYEEVTISNGCRTEISVRQPLEIVTSSYACKMTESTDKSAIMNSELVSMSPTVAFFSTIVPSMGATMSTRAQFSSCFSSSLCRLWISSASALTCLICWGSTTMRARSSLTAIRPRQFRLAHRLFGNGPGPHVTGKMWPWLVPSFSAATISSWEISSPSR